MSRKLAIVAALFCSGGLAAWSGSAGCAEGRGSESTGPRWNLVVGEAVGDEAPVIGGVAARPVIQRENPFRISIPRASLPRDASGISEILLEVYDPEAARWKGYGMMELQREHVDGGAPRVVGASIDFIASAEGIYCLRTRSRDRAGNVRRKAADLKDVEMVVVLDRTPPAVKLVKPKPRAETLGPGSELEITWTATDDFPTRTYWDPEKKQTCKSHRVEVSHDGGQTWKPVPLGELTDPGTVSWEVKGPNTDALLVRVTVRDAAGNVGEVRTETPMRLAGFVGSHQTQLMSERPMLSAARRTYQRGVIYMTRGDHARAAKEFEEARKLDVAAAQQQGREPTLVQAWLNLSACYLRLYEEQQRRDPRYGATYLEQAEGVLRDGLSREGFEKEVALHYNLSRVYFHRGGLDDAAACVRRGLAHAPRHIESLFMLAVIRYRQQDFEEAGKLWRQVAALGGSAHPLARRAVRCLDHLRTAAAGTRSS
jgi:tetratricopeptide (TPR) repeat protein